MNTERLVIPKSATWIILETTGPEMTCYKCGGEMAALGDLLAFPVSGPQELPGVWWCEECGILGEASGGKMAYHTPLNERI